MTHSVYTKSVTVFMSLLLGASVANADIGKIGGPAIGKIGSPVTPSNLPKKNDGTGDKQEGGLKEQQPLAVVTFNQQRINIAKIIDGPVGDHEKDARGSSYDVVTIISSNTNSPSRTARLNEIYARNTSLVLYELERMGIASTRVHSSTEYKSDNSPQEVIIYASPQ